MISATMNQAKLLGIDGKQLTTDPDVESGLGHFYGSREPLTVEVARVIDKKLEDEY